ncbi:MAG: hypothetical protein K9L71_01440 [Candidatus Omnitrophica bacterium]|nr:hypothetical protein [Candidatus Omnitrophota bacterium]
MRPKVLKWPREDCLFGFVGAAEVDNKPIHEWLATLTDEFNQEKSLRDIAETLNNKVQEQRKKDEGQSPAQPLIIHIGGFEKKEGHWIPEVWHIRNVYKLGQFGYLDFRKYFFSMSNLGSILRVFTLQKLEKPLRYLLNSLNHSGFTKE